MISDFKDFFFLKEEKVIRPEQEFNNVFIILGLPGAGKSTIQRLGLIDAPNLQLLTPDKWIELFAKKNKRDLTDSSQTNKIYQEIKPTFSRFSFSALKKDTNVNYVIEKIGGDLESLKKIIKICKDKELNIILVLVKVSLENALLGNSQRTRSVPRDVIDYAFHNLERNFNTLKTNPDIDEIWVLDNDQRPTYSQFRSSEYIQKIK